MNNSILAWHFSDGELRFDYAGVKVEAGLVLETEEKPTVEKTGFHACQSPLDALHWYAVRPQSEFVISRVRLSKEMIHGSHYDNGRERIVAQKREHLWVADAKPVLEKFVEEQKLRLEENHKLTRELVFSPSGLYWLSDETVNNLPNRDKQAKDIEKILLHPLGNRVLELAKLVLQSEKLNRSLQIWEKARQDAFDLNAYLEENRNRYKGIRLINHDWAFQNPPEKYSALVAKPKDPAEVFHEMLMRLAPEGYEE